MRKNNLENWRGLYSTLKLLPDVSLGRVFRYAMGHFFEEEGVDESLLKDFREKALCNVLILLINKIDE